MEAVTLRRARLSPELLRLPVIAVVLVALGLAVAFTPNDVPGLPVPGAM